MRKEALSNLNAADWLSISRIIVAPFLILVLLFGNRYLFATIFVLAILTDLIDGYLARRMHMVSKHGARLDSTGDLLLFIAGAIGVFYYETQFVLDHKWWIGAAFTLYFIQLLFGLIKYKRPSSLHTYCAKIAAAFQGIFIGSALFFGAWEWLFYIALIISIIETLEEMILIYILDEWRTDVKGIYWVLKEKDN